MAGLEPILDQVVDRKAGSVEGVVLIGPEAAPGGGGELVEEGTERGEQGGEPVAGSKALVGRGNGGGGEIGRGGGGKARRLAVQKKESPA